MMPFFLKNSSGQILIKGLLLTFHGNMPATRATNLFTNVDLVNYPGKKYNGAIVTIFDSNKRNKLCREGEMPYIC